MSNLSDVVGEANLFGGSSYSFTYDRFCSPNSAIYFNQGYLQVPTGVYFSGDFTVTVWIYLKSYLSWSRIFDFGNGSPNENVYLSIIDTNSKLQGYIWRVSSESRLDTSSIISLNQWYFIAFVLKGTTGSIYANGNQVATGSLLIPINVVRTNNFIGKNNWYGFPNTDAIYDEFKIYQLALSSSDIINEFNISSNNGK